MNKSILTVAVLAIALSGSAHAQAPIQAGSQATTQKQALTKEEKKAARKAAFKSGMKGCGVGAAVSAIGSLFGGKVNAKGLVGGCAVGGVTAGAIEYRNQVNEFRAFQGQVTVGAVATVSEKEVQVEGKATKAANLTLNLEQDKVTARSADITKVMTELSVMLNRQKVPMTVTCSGSAKDRAWFCGHVRTQVTNESVTFIDGYGAEPVVNVSPMPAME